MAEAKCLAYIFVLLYSACGKEQIVDLTHTLGEDSLFWAGLPSFKFNILERGQKQNFWYEINNISMAEHGGTHLDSPSHFYKGKWRLHEIPMINLIGPGVIIDISERAKIDPDTQVEVSDILAFEREYGEIPDRAMVLMNSGWGEKWPNRTEVFGTNDPSNPATFHFPGFSGNAIRWLIKNRKHINAVGVDTPSIDFGQTQDYITHVTAFSVNIVGLENVANLDKIPVTGSMIYAIPLKIRDGSGSPARVFAMFNGENTSINNRDSLNEEL